MSKKTSIIISVSVIGAACVATGLSIWINASIKKNETLPIEPTPIKPTSITFVNDSIINLKNSLVSIIDNEKLTSDEFNSNLLENIKRNFNVDNKNIGNLITRVEFDNQSTLKITLNKTNTKYSLSTNFDNILATLSDDVGLVSTVCL